MLLNKLVGFKPETEIIKEMKNYDIQNSGNSFVLTKKGIFNIKDTEKGELFMEKLDLLQEFKANLQAEINVLQATDIEAEIAQKSADFAEKLRVDLKAELDKKIVEKQTNLKFLDGLIEKAGESASDVAIAENINQVI